MSESMRMWMEIIFNVAYLVVVWILVIAMVRRQPTVPTSDKPVTKLFIWAFALLALGDTGHVGFRVMAYAQGSLDSTLSLGGLELGLVGLGALATAVTVTVFYVIMLMIWQRRYGKPYGWFGVLLFAAAVFRLIIMLFPANEWNSSVPPKTWSLIRNIPLMILLSYAFYIPVILFVQEVPLIGMLMIPKTMAYVGIALIAYYSLFKKKEETEDAYPAMAD